MAKHERLRRDMAGVGPEPRRAGLHPLSDLKDFQIGRGEPDIRGWEVRTLSGRDVGKVDDLLVDTDAGEVVMMDVEMRGSDRHIELPLRTAQLDHQAHRVMVDSGDLELYAGTVADARAHDREAEVLDRDSRIEDRIEDERELRARQRLEEEQERERLDDEVSREARTRARQADSIERRPLPEEARGDADEVVVERRPVIEEVVIRRKVIDND